MAEQTTGVDTTVQFFLAGFQAHMVLFILFIIIININIYNLIIIIIIILIIIIIIRIVLSLKWTTFLETLMNLATLFLMTYFMT